MSYSFIVRAENKAQAKAYVEAEFDKVVATQAAHAHDRAQAQAAAFAFIDTLADDDTKMLQVNVHGSVSWAGSGADTSNIIAAAVGVSVHYTMREEPTPVEDEAA